MNDKVKNCAKSSTKEVLDLLTASWHKQAIPVNMLREFASTPLAAAVATIIYRGAISGDWEPVSLTLETLSSAGFGLSLDILCRGIKVFTHRKEYDSKTEVFLDGCIGGIKQNKGFMDRAHGALWRVVVPAFTTAMTAYSMTVYADDSDASWEWGSLLENVSIATGVGAATGGLLDLSFKTANRGVDSIWSCIRGRRNAGDTEFEYDQIDEEADFYNPDARATYGSR